MVKQQDNQKAEKSKSLNSKQVRSKKQATKGATKGATKQASKQLGSNHQAPETSLSADFLRDIATNGTNEQLNEVLQKLKQAERRATKAKERRAKAEKELSAFVRVGCKYYKEVFPPDKTGQGIRSFAEWQKGTIIDDYGKENLELIRQFDGFCCVPQNVNFQLEINGFFNEYAQLTHQPKQGDFPVIRQILSHVFGQSFINFAYDYLQLLYLNPLQRLPIILLESSEKNTGKSTFGTLLKLLFQNNAIKLGNSDMESDFNGFWLKRLAIVVDETSLEKKGVMQMIKRLSTETSTVTSNEKNTKQTQTEFYGKFVFMSNDEGKALPIERGDTRFAVFKVPTFASMGITEVPNIEQRIQDEIPHFLHHLQNRTLYHPNKSRMYFDVEVYQTPQLKSYFKNAISYVGKAIRELIEDCFKMFDTEECLKFSIANIQAELRAGNYLKHFDKTQVRKGLDELGVSEDKKQRYVYYSLGMAQVNEQGYALNQNNRVYIFNREDFES